MEDPGRDLGVEVVILVPGSGTEAQLGTVTGNGEGLMALGCGMGVLRAGMGVVDKENGEGE
jgi:hypothetical protein